MAEEAIVTDPQQVQQPYIDKVYSALKDNLQGFNKTPEQFKSAMKDSSYAAKAYNALKDNLQGFEKPQEQFYQQVGLKKKDLPNVASTTAPQLGNGLPTFQSSPQPTNIPLTPYTPEKHQELVQQDAVHDEQVRQQRQANIDKQNKQLSDIYNKLDPETKKQWNDVQQLAASQSVGELHQKSQQDIDHDNFMDKHPVLRAINYMGSEGAHGTLQLLKGVTHEFGKAMNLSNPATDLGEEILMGKADKAADLGLSKNDIAQAKDNKVVNGLGMMTNFAPSILAGTALKAPQAMMFLQGVGQGKELAQNLDLNPTAKEALIQGSGAVNLLLNELPIFGKGVSGSVKGKVASGIAMDAIKESAGKDLTETEFTDLLKKGANTFAEKFAKAPVEALSHYNNTVKTFAKLNVGNFALHKAVDELNDKPVFNETAGNLADNLYKSTTQDAPLFSAIPAAAELTKLTPFSGYKNDVVESLISNPKDENVANIKQQLQEHGQQQGWTREELDATNKHVDKIVGAVKSLPHDLPENKRSKAVGLVLDRNTLQDQLNAIQEQKKGLDTSIADIPTKQETFLTDKVEQANDKLRDIVSGTRTTYSKELDEKTGEETGKYFKTVNGKKEEITPSRYALENLERTAKVNEAPKQAEPIAENGVPEAPQEVPATKVNEEPTNNLTNTKIQEDGKNELREQQVGQESRQEGGISNEKGSTQEEAQLPAEEKVVNTGDAKAEPDIKVKDVLDKPVTYHGEPAIITQDGQTLVAKIKNSNREYELGHADEIGEKSIKDLGIEHDNSVVKSNENGNIVVRDKEYVNNYSDPLSAINKDKDGNVVSVNLETADGKKRTFKGDVAEDIAYQIHLKELNKDNETKEQFEQFVGQHEPAKEAIVAAEDANTAEKGTVADNAEVSRKPARKRTVKAEPKQGGVNEPIPTTDSTDAKQETKGRPESEVRQVPENKGEQKTSLSEAEAKRKLELRKKFSGQLNDITRIPTLLADKDFREYAGLVFKEAAGDFKQFSKELIDSVGEKIREHLPNLFKDLGGDEKQLPKDSEATGVRNADVTQERGEDVQRTKKTKEQVEAEGKRLVDSGDVDPDDLAKSIIDKPRPVTAEEQAALLYHKTKLKNKQRELFKETTPESEAQYARNEDLIEQNRQATEIIGNETGRTLGARTDQMAEDYSRINILNRAKKANGGELDPKDEAELTARTKRVEELEAKLADREEQIRRMHENGLTDRVKRATEREEKDAKRAITKASLRKEREGLLADLHLIAKKSLKTTGINKIPVDMVVPLTKLARNYVLDGVVTLSGVVDKIYHDLKEHVEGLEKGDISEIVKENFDKYLHEQNQIRLDRSKKAANTKLEKLKEQSLTGNFEKTVNRKIQVDNDYLKIRADIKREQTLINKKIFEIENSQKSIGRKAVDFAVKWGRNSKLASIPVLGKLILTGVTTMGTKALTEGTGLFYSAILPNIAEKSTIEGGANVAALAKSYAKAATLGMKDAYDELNIKSGGQSDLSALYGKYIESRLPAEAADFFGHLHSAIKAPIKRQAWEYSYAKRVARQIEAGIDVHDPVTDAKNRLDAYKDAERAIFMGDNSISSAYEAAMKTLENKDSPAAKNVAALTRILLPFVKVPTNIALSSGRYAFGLIPGLGKLAQIGTSGALRAAGAEGLAKVIHSGMGELTPEESDMVLRNLKHGTVGGAVLLIGYFNPKNVGGYYQPGEKRKPSDVNAGSLKVFGHKIPVWMTEHPLFQAMQMGATFRRVLDAHKAKNDNISAAALATASGLAEAIPLANEAKNLTDMMGSDTKKFNKFISQTVKGEIEPAFLQQIALVTDTKDKSLVTFDDKNQQKRAPDKKHGLLKYMKQDLETGIPGLRKNVPKK